MAYTTINKSTDYFNNALYTGNGGSLSVTGVGHQPDFTWVKCRTIAYFHNLFDSVRGVSRSIRSSSTAAEVYASGEGVTAFNADGYTMVQGSTFEQGNNSVPYASWNWKAGTTSGITQGGASITPAAYSFNQTSGFSIIKYTGTGSNATIPHGLGAVPKMIIVRNTTDVEQWVIYHAGLDTSSPEDYHVRLNTSDVRVDEASVWNDTAPTSNVFSVGSSGAPNGNGDNHIAYCFEEKKGFSKFGSYTGNGNSSGNGPFVYTGFKPAFVIYKNKSAVYHWGMYDNKREPFNVCEDLLIPNLANTESNNDGRKIDMLSNGFKVKVTSDTNDINGSGNTIIYWAFAENPLVGTNKVPATAR